MIFIKYLLFLAVSTFLISVSAIALPGKKIVVLVPGYFNSLAPGFLQNQKPEIGPYWSIDIIQTFQAQGFPTIYVANNLNPFGTLAENSARLDDYLRRLHSSLADQNVEFYLVGHSAGGLYALTVAARSQLPITKVVSISTPLAGASIVESTYGTWFGNVAQWLSLDSIRELTAENVRQYLLQIRLPEKLKYFVYGGYQPADLNFLRAENLSFPFYLAGKVIGEPSDGIISLSSALNTHVRLKTQNDKPFQVNLETRDIIHLDHAEQVLDFHIFELLGTTNAEFIRNEQIRFYSNVARRLLAP